MEKTHFSEAAKISEYDIRRTGLDREMVVNIDNIMQIKPS